MMISSSRMELLELFLPVASNSPTKTFFVMGCKGPISHLFHKRVFQHRTNWSIAVSQGSNLGLQKGQVQDKSKLFKHHMTVYREPTHIYTPCTLESSQSPTETQITLQSAEGVKKG